jgi:hypothetical protein
LQKKRPDEIDALSQGRQRATPKPDSTVGVESK